MKLLAKSPLNYVGNKYKQLPQLLNIFPQNINNFIDLFCGGGDVAANITANNIYANDINYQVIEIMQEFQQHTIEEIIQYIDNRIQEFDLSKTNEEGYLKYRELYNKPGSGYNSPLDLFTITRFSYNWIIRFNNKMKFNSSFGRNKCDYNQNMRNNTIAFYQNIQEINFSTLDFRKFSIDQFTKQDFLYADPPYLIATADYNMGRTQKLSWKIDDELALYRYLDEAGNKINWAMSNFIKHKGKINNTIEEWANDNKYNIYILQSDYSKLTTKAERIYEPTMEVLITNYN